MSDFRDLTLTLEQKHYDRQGNTGAFSDAYRNVFKLTLRSPLAPPRPHLSL